MRCFIIGNGPSLKDTNLDLIVGQPSFSCNRIDLIYPFTKWRPTAYVRMEAMDVAGISKDKFLPSIQTHVDMGIQCLLSEYFEPEIGFHPNVTYLKACHDHEYNYDDIKSSDEWHLPGLCSFGGSVNMSMQIAITQDFDELVLLGCDLGYRDHAPSHFDSSYEHGGEQSAWYANRNAFWGHICAINWLARNRPDVKVWNATNGGYLELYERVKLSDIA